MYEVGYFILKSERISESNYPILSESDIGIRI